MTFALWRSPDPGDEAKGHLVMTIDRPSRTIHGSPLAFGTFSPGDGGIYRTRYFSMLSFPILKYLYFLDLYSEGIVLFQG